MRGWIACFEINAAILQQALFGSFVTWYFPKCCKPAAEYRERRNIAAKPAIVRRTSLSHVNIDFRQNAANLLHATDDVIPQFKGLFGVPKMLMQTRSVGQTLSCPFPFHDRERANGEIGHREIWKETPLLLPYGEEQQATHLV